MPTILSLLGASEDIWRPFESCFFLPLKAKLGLSSMPFSGQSEDPPTFIICGFKKEHMLNSVQSYCQSNSLCKHLNIIGTSPVDWKIMLLLLSVIFFEEVLHESTLKSSFSTPKRQAERWPGGHAATTRQDVLEELKWGYISVRLVSKFLCPGWVQGPGRVRVILWIWKPGTLRVISGCYNFKKMCEKDPLEHFF